MKISVYIATSLDGFIARSDGRVDWLDAVSQTAGDEDYGYHAFADSVDCIVMGRATVELVMGFTPWPYEGKRLIVLSRSWKELPPALVGKATLHPGPVADLAAQLRAEGLQRLYIDGGQTIQAFLNAGLITDMTISTIPILLGEGLPLFGPTAGDIPLKHIRTQAFPSGLVQTTYEL